jgi:alkyl hydroperoxide reductase subunit AhpC
MMMIGKYLVLFFYPLDFTFVCPTEIIAFSERVKEFREIGCEVVAASCDSEYSHLAWINTPRKEGGLGNMNIPIIADSTKSIARDYNVLIEEEGISLRYADDDDDDEDSCLTLLHSGLFIINPEGVLRSMMVNDLPVGRSVDEVLRLVKAFQYTDKHGEVCPAGWTPGAATMVAEPHKSKEYFSKVNQ